jgi:hypothetical protein
MTFWAWLGIICLVLAVVGTLGFAFIGWIFSRAGRTGGDKKED